MSPAGSPLIYDTRDNEYNTHQGLLLEAGTQVGQRAATATPASTPSCAATSRCARAPWWRRGSPARAWAARRPLDARFALPGWEKAVPVLGGQYSHRGARLRPARPAAGPCSATSRSGTTCCRSATWARVTPVAFLDAGRVFEQEIFRLTTEDMKVGGGGGVALRILRSQHLHVQLRGRAGRVQLLGGERLDVLGGGRKAARDGSNGVMSKRGSGPS